MSDLHPEIAAVLNGERDWCLIHGDCREILPTLPDKSIDMVFTDPPYGHNNNNNGDLASRWEAVFEGRKEQYSQAEEWRPIHNDGHEEASDLLKFCAKEYARLFVNGGCCCCCCCCGGGGPDPQFARWSLWLDEVLKFKHMVIWDKGPIGMGHHYRRSYETVLVAQKGGAACKWYDTSKRIENVIRPNTLGIRKIIPQADEHPTEKPPELAAFFIKLHSLEGEIVLDPFVGSGSTGEAALKMGRRFIGIELDERWIPRAKQRLEAAHTQQRLLI